MVRCRPHPSSDWSITFYSGMHVLKITSQCFYATLQFTIYILIFLNPLKSIWNQKKRINYHDITIWYWYISQPFMRVDSVNAQEHKLLMYSSSSNSKVVVVKLLTLTRLSSFSRACDVLFVSTVWHWRVCRRVSVVCKVKIKAWAEVSTTDASVYSRRTESVCCNRNISLPFSADLIISWNTEGVSGVSH